jgi:hypothetical protein
VSAPEAIELDPAERARIDAAIDEGVRYAGLSDTQRGFVVMYLHRDPVEWLSCCGSYCDPCVQTIGRAVERARHVLGLPAWGSSP